MAQRAYYDSPVADLDEQILTLIDQGVSICERPFLRIAQSISLGEMALILRIQWLMKEQRIYHYPRKRPRNAAPVAHINRPVDSDRPQLSHWDLELISLLKKGLPLSSRPFHIFAKQLDLPVDEVLFRVQRLKQQGYVSKVGPIV